MRYSNESEAEKFINNTSSTLTEDVNKLQIIDQLLKISKFTPKMMEHLVKMSQIFSVPIVKLSEADCLEVNQKNTSVSELSKVALQTAKNIRDFTLGSYNSTLSNFDFLVFCKF